MTNPVRTKIPVAQSAAYYLQYCVTKFSNDWPTAENSLAKIFGTLPDGEARVTVKNECFIAVLSLDSHGVDTLFPDVKDEMLTCIATELEKLSPEQAPADTLLDYRNAWDMGLANGNMPPDQVAIRFIERAQLPFRVSVLKEQKHMDPTQILQVSHQLVLLCSGTWKGFAELYELTR